MGSLLRWRQSWVPGPSTPSMSWGEGWSESWQLGSASLAMTGHASIVGDTTNMILFEAGSGSMDMVGHCAPSVQGMSYPLETIPSFGGTMPISGHVGVTGTFDFDEPFFVDPPLELHASGHMAGTATTVVLINKSVGSGSITLGGRTRFGITTIAYQTAVVKQLLSVSLAAAGRSSVAGSIGSTSVKGMGAGSMAMGGRSSIAQTGFSIEAPAPYTHPLGTAVLTLVCGAEVTGDPLWTDIPPHDLGSVTIAASAYCSVSTSRLFSGGLWSMPALSLNANGRSSIGTSLSYPGETYPNTEAVAVYEGLDMQESFADLENDGVVVG